MMSGAILAEAAFKSTEELPDGLKFRARIGILRSTRSFILAAILLGIAASIYTNLDSAPQQFGVQRLGIYGFLCLLSAIGLVNILHGVHRFRNRLEITMLEDRIEAAQTGLLTRRSSTQFAPDRRYYLVVTYRDQDSLAAMWGDPKSGNASSERNVRVASLDIVNENAQRVRLLNRFNGWQPMLEAARQIATFYRLSEATLVDLSKSPDEKSALRTAHKTFLEAV